MPCTLHPDFSGRPIFPEDRRKIAKVMPYSMRWAAGTNRGPEAIERQKEIADFFNSDDAHGHWVQYFRSGQEGVIHFDDGNTFFQCKLRFG